MQYLSITTYCLAWVAFLGIIAATLWNLIKKRWLVGILNLILVFTCGAVTLNSFYYLLFASFLDLSDHDPTENSAIRDAIEWVHPSANKMDTSEESTIPDADK